MHLTPSRQITLLISAHTQDVRAYGRTQGWICVTHTHKCSPRWVMSEPPHPSPTSGFSVREKLSISVHWSSCWHPASAPAAAALAAGGSALCWCKHEPPSLACAINAPIPLLLLLLVFGLNSQSRCDTELSLTLPDVKFYQLCWFISCFILLTLVLVFPVSLTDRVLPFEIAIGPALIGLTCSRVSAVIVLSLPWLSHVVLSSCATFCYVLLTARFAAFDHHLFFGLKIWMCCESVYTQRYTHLLIKFLAKMFGRLVSHQNDTLWLFPSEWGNSIYSFRTSWRRF